MPDAPTLVERLGRPLWIDFVADTGDDRDVSRGGGAASCSRVRRRRRVPERQHPAPRGDILLFGGDTAYPVATGRRDPQAASSSSRGTRCSGRSATGGRRRVAPRHPRQPRLVRRSRRLRPAVPPSTPWSACWRSGKRGRAPPRAEGSARRPQPRRSWPGSSTSTRSAGSVDLVRSAYQSLRAFVRGGTVHRVARLALRGYIADPGGLALGLAPRARPRAVGRRSPAPARSTSAQRDVLHRAPGRAATAPARRSSRPIRPSSFGERNAGGQRHAGRVSPHARVRTACSI